MLKLIGNLLGGFLILLFVAGCFPQKARLLSVKSNDVDSIPTRLGLYPILTEPTPGRESLYGSHSQETFGLNQDGNNIIITQPFESKLAVTRESQILTGLISTQLSSYGFILNEIPVEMISDEQNALVEKEGRVQYAISTDLLKQLRDENGLEALLVGNAFFIADPGYDRRLKVMKVTSAHFKIIDAETLQILGQVNLPYEISYGREMHELADEIAYSLAQMADLIED